MRPAFLLIFWGLLVVAVDVTVDQTDLLLPDVIGYLMIITAAMGLARVNRQFAKVTPFAACAAVLWVLATLRMLQAPLLDVAIILCDMAVVWFLCTGISELAMERSNADLARSAVRRRGYLVAALLLQVPVILLALVAAPLAAPLVVALVIFTLIIWLTVLLLIWRAAAELGAPS